MVKVKEDLTGRTFGRLTVLEQAEDYVSRKGEHRARWLCVCNCENKTELFVDGTALKNGHTKSCGCISVERLKKYNEYQLNLEDENGLYGIGYCLNTGNPFYFDMDDYDKIKDYCWREEKKYGGYRQLKTNVPNSKKSIAMHYLIADKYYDHVDRNTFNNRKHNLRKASIVENTRNKSLRSDSTSGFLGVNWHVNNQKWQVRISVYGKEIHLGYFTEKEDAIRARLEAEAKYFGEFAPQRHLFEQYKINVEDGDTNDLS